MLGATVGSLVAVFGCRFGGAWCQDWVRGCCFGWVPLLDLSVVCCMGVVLVAVRDTDIERQNEVAVFCCAVDVLRKGTCYAGLMLVYIFFLRSFLAFL